MELDSDAPKELSDARSARLSHAAAHRIAGLRCVLERVEDRGNRAAALRTCEALGILHVHEVAPAQPQLGRARGVAHGGEKWLMVHQHTSAEECRAALDGFNLLAALPPRDPEAPASVSWQGMGGRRRRKRGGGNQGEDAPPPAEEAEPQPPPPLPAAVAEPVALEKLDFARPTALVFGNERLGCSAEMLAACDGAFHIPLHGLTESLNVSVACAISLHYGRLARVAALKALGADGGLNAAGGDLSDAEVAALLAEYAARGKQHAKPKGETSAEGAAATPPVEKAPRKGPGLPSGEAKAAFNAEHGERDGKQPCWFAHNGGCSKEDEACAFWHP